MCGRAFVGTAGDVLGVRDVLGSFSNLTRTEGDCALHAELMFVFYKVAVTVILFFTRDIIGGTVGGVLIIGRKKRFIRFGSVRRSLLCRDLLGNRYHHATCFLGDFSELSLRRGHTHTLFLIGGPSTGAMFTGCRTSHTCNSTLRLKIICGARFRGVVSVHTSNRRCRIEFSSVLDVVGNSSVEGMQVIDRNATVRTAPHFPRGASNFFFHACSRRCRLL